MLRGQLTGMVFLEEKNFGLSRVNIRDVEAEAEAGSGSGGNGTFSVEVEAEAEARKIHRFRFHIGGKNGEKKRNWFCYPS